MTKNGFLEDDELILYAMQALSEAEERTVAAQLAKSEDLRQRLAEIKTSLGLYAEAVVDPVDIPAGGLERLMASISQYDDVVPMHPREMTKGEARTITTSSPIASGRAAWAGWLVAATLLVAAAMEFQQGMAFRQTIARQSDQLRQATAASSVVARERDALKETMQEEIHRDNASRDELSTYKDQAAALGARVNAEANRAQREVNRATDLASIANANAREAAQLKGTLATQSEQVAQLSAEAADARRVLDALSDPSALRVALTVPRQKKSPSGRGTYVAREGTLIFTGSDLAPLLANEVYQLWLMPSNSGSPIPAGTFVPDVSGNATMVSTHFQKAIAAKGFAVTKERAGGSQTPTLPILLASL
jgi:hypothetical protein